MTHHKKPVVLLDCDGVICDFIGGLIYRLDSKMKLTHESFKSWELSSTLGADAMGKVDDIVCEPEFCKGLYPIYGAHGFIYHLRRMAHVVCVTSPWTGSRHWMEERRWWLENEFNFDPADIIQTRLKHMVRGDIIIDDNIENINRWAEHNRCGRAVLVKRPWNRDHLSSSKADATFSMFAGIVDYVQDNT